jgi:hypothetical protein
MRLTGPTTQEILFYMTALSVRFGPFIDQMRR